MSHARLREIKRLAQGHTADKRPDQDSDCKVHVLEISSTHKSNSKDSSDLGRSGASLGDTQTCGLLLYAPTKATSHSIYRDSGRPESQQRKLSGQLPSVCALGLCTQATEEGVLKPESFSTHPRNTMDDIVG